MNNTEISWHVHLVIKAGCLDRFRDLTDEMIKSAELESGLLIFERFINTDGTEAHVYERYRDSTAAEDHLKTFSDEFGDRFGALVERKSFTVLGNPSQGLRELLGRYGASDYFEHFASYTRIN